MAKRSFYRAANAVFGKIGMPFAEASLFFSKFFSSLLRSTTLESFSGVDNDLRLFLYRRLDFLFPAA